MRMHRAQTLTARLLLVVAALLATSGVAQAHQIWLDREGPGTKLYFGEYGANLHEVSPGFLDKLTRVSATVLSARGEKAVESKRTGTAS